ncbi:unnamed protein product [Cyprideis torosa]|uniref:Anthranilate synthase component 2 n=1 Tax=Cyprideis torosa TaxID=163714 RepID=A0A7R8WCP1_9CRUS|nr:unnamed protein product [Cyprideis torosa]CAG0893731.1 unnamed protein product [Cyprideis torosa]
MRLSELKDSKESQAEISRLVEELNKDTNEMAMLSNSLSWDAIPYFENIQLHADGNPAQIADLRLGLYQILIVFDHYHDEMELIEYLPDGDTSILDQIKTHIRGPLPEKTTFNAEDENSSNIGDERFMEMVALGKKHCFRGDVFQIVPSRQFRRKYSGDDFNLYRSLRAINPSPYLFYFDYGDYRVMGSSPEAQTVINGQEAYIDPIAGTFKRTHDPKKDAALAQALQDDPKETAEHIMLVDLARNDLSRNSSEVRVKTFKEVHYFSHVLHMVSRVTAQLPQGFNNLKVFGDAFPAGTLSGAPKYRALELIDQMENQNRGIYGGALGFFGFDGDVNTAIVIRSFVSQNGVLYSQAGAGVVSESVEESELQEVNNKLGALDKAVLVLDNYDSFTFNLVHSIKKVVQDVSVFRNDEIALEAVAAYDKIVLSPGPGIPDEANLLKPIIAEYADKKSMLGVCLGQQAMAEVFGGQLLNTQKVYHGVATKISVLKDDILFQDMPKELEVGRYHSWVVDREGFPDDLEITAETPEGAIMALRHKTFDVRGVQFHPESILTPYGDQMIRNWILGN